MQAILITPPPELVEQWRKSAPADAAVNNAYERHIATRAAQYGADQELEACLEWTTANFGELPGQNLHLYRRPKPPRLKEQAQSELDRLIALIPSEGALAMAEPIRRALETLPE